MLHSSPRKFKTSCIAIAKLREGEMADWLVRNAESTKVDLQHKQVSIRIRRTLGIKEGDRLVLLAAPGMQPTFSHVATVKRIRMSQEEDIRLYNVDVDDWR